MEDNKLILIDGNSYIHRAFHAIPRLTDSRGNAVNAVFGFMKMLKKVIADEAPSHVFVAFDHKKPTFRHKDFKAYKAHREAIDPELAQQFPRVFKVLGALNMKCLDYEGFEADDIIGLLHRGDSVCVGQDKDLLTVPGLHYNYRVKEYEDVSEEQALRYFYGQMLTGDSADNIPGLSNTSAETRTAFGLRKANGCGPVAAAGILKGVSDRMGLYRRVREAFLSYNIEQNPEVEVATLEQDTDVDLLEIGRLLHMTRKLDKNGSPVLWELPSK